LLSNCYQPFEVIIDFLKTPFQLNCYPFSHKILTIAIEQNMLRINIPSNGPSKLTFTELKKHEIPAPPDGFNSEINDEVIFQFEDEQEAIDYAHDLDQYADSVEHTSQEYLVITDIIKAISDDEFVQDYIQS
jgi:hypothetical protein